MRPSWHPIWLQCKNCDHKWDDWQPWGVPISTWIAHVNTYRCPSCSAGFRNILLRMNPIKEEPS